MINIQNLRRHSFWKGKGFYLVVGIILMVLVGGRLAVGNFDFSYFIVAGDDFVNGNFPAVIQPGQGYDGQFFYRYALSPSDPAQVKFGIQVDLPPYRYQRIAYPLLTWLFSFGNADLVPVMLVLINVLAFFGIIYYTRKFIYKIGGVPVHHYLPLLLCGLYMSLGRDLSEVCELFFFMGSFYYLMRYDFLKYAFFATLTLLTRETSVLALLPIALYYFLNSLKNGFRLSELVMLMMPFIFFAAWKFWVISQTGSEQSVSASGNMGSPFTGMVEGFFVNAQISSVKDLIEFILWVLHFTWQWIFTVIVFRSIFKSGQRPEGEWMRPLVAVYITWFVFALCLSSSIYSDDWSFVRVFSLWNMTGFLILMLRRQPLNSFFKAFSILLVIMTVGRLIFRV